METKQTVSELERGILCVADGSGQSEQADATGLDPTLNGENMRF
jgi:hypothetical protein